MSNIYEVTMEFLVPYFYDGLDAETIPMIKTNLNKRTFKKKWGQIKKAIHARQFAPGEALTLVHEGANRVLYENTEEEAYIWLDKMVENIERTDGIIDEY